MKWQLISNQAVKLHSWDNESVVYNTLSGDTHLLGQAAAQILTQLRQAPADAASLTEALSRVWQVDPTEDLALQIDEILADLRTLAFIEEAA
jgi:PqqD family protein of HPr-rel-A system